MSDYIAPCPFCGSKNIELICSGSAWFVECRECQATGPMMVDGDDRDSARAVELWAIPPRTKHPLSGKSEAALAEPQHESVGEVVIGEEGMTKGWTVIKWRADLPPIAVGTKLYAEPQASLKPLTREQIDVIWSAQGSFTDRESDYRCFARAIEQSHNIGVKP